MIKNHNPEGNDYRLFISRIRKVQSILKEKEILFIFAAHNAIRNRDVEYKFRQNSDFYYLTGITESDSILVLTHSRSILFCLPKDKKQEIWTGIRLGKDKIKKILELDETYEISEFNDKLPKLLENHHTVFHFWGQDLEKDKLLLSASNKVLNQIRDGKLAPEKFIIPYFLHELRLKKTKEELEFLKKAAEITKIAHIRAMQEAKPGMYEYELEAILEKTYLEHGAWGPGYPHIVASGKNACILHYNQNSDILKKGSLVLIDSGAEKNYYTADVTRTFPVDKKFPPAASLIYEIVLASQKNAISLCKEGVEFYDIHDKTVSFLVDCLLDLKLLKGKKDTIIEKGLYKKYFMHRIGHYLGMDVHDVGKYYLNGERRKLETGMVVTIEPGLYFDPEDESIPKEFRGIGIRIEDDIYIQGSNPQNLTADIPKEISEIEELRV